MKTENDKNQNRLPVSFWILLVVGSIAAGIFLPFSLLLAGIVLLVLVSQAGKG